MTVHRDVSSLLCRSWNGRVVDKERRLPVFQFDKAFGIARDVKVFLNLHSGVTRGEVPDFSGHKKQVEKLRNSRRLDREKIKKQAETLRYAQQHMGSLREEIESKKREIFQLKNELCATEEKVESTTKVGSANPGTIPTTLSHNPVRFVNLFVGRSGSSYLIEALNAHPEIRAKREILAHKSENKQARRVRKALMPLPYGEHAAVGFKTKLVDVKNPARLAKLLREVEARIILLRRRNIVKHTASWINAWRLHSATGHWNLYNEEDRLPPFTIEVAEFSRVLEQIEKEKRELESYVKDLQLPTLSIYYEDLLGAQRTTLERVFSFLEVQCHPVQGRSIKNTSDNLREVVSNIDELLSYYVGTPYEQMFDEILVSE